MLPETKKQQLINIKTFVKTGTTTLIVLKYKNKRDQNKKSAIKTKTIQLQI